MGTLAILAIVFLVHVGEGLKCYKKDLDSNAIREEECGTSCYSRNAVGRKDGNYQVIDQKGCHYEHVEAGCKEVEIDGIVGDLCYCNTDLCNVGRGSLTCLRKALRGEEMYQIKCGHACYSKIGVGSAKGSELDCYDGTGTTGCWTTGFLMTKFTRCNCNTNLCNDVGSGTPDYFGVHAGPPDYVGLKCYKKDRDSDAIREEECATTCYSKNAVGRKDGNDQEIDQKGCHYEQVGEVCKEVEIDGIVGELCFCNTDLCNVGRGSLTCLRKAVRSLEMYQVKCGHTCYSKVVGLGPMRRSLKLDCHDYKRTRPTHCETRGSIVDWKLTRCYCNTNLCNVGPHHVRVNAGSPYAHAGPPDDGGVHSGTTDSLHFLFTPLILVPYFIQRIRLLINC